MADEHFIKKENIFSIQPFTKGDEKEMADLIAYTLKESNGNDYSPEYIEGIIRIYSPEAIAQRAKDAHFYVFRDRGRVIACGGIICDQDNIDESHLISVFVHPGYQGRGIGKRIVEVLESDEFFTRAQRTELDSSITAVGFYQEMGYTFRDEVHSPDEYGVVKMEKKRSLLRQ